MPAIQSADCLCPYWPNTCLLYNQQSVIVRTGQTHACYTISSLSLSSVLAKHMPAIQSAVCYCPYWPNTCLLYNQQSVIVIRTGQTHACYTISSLSLSVLTKHMPTIQSAVYHCPYWPNTCLLYNQQSVIVRTGQTHACYTISSLSLSSVLAKHMPVIQSAVCHCPYWPNTCLLYNQQSVIVRTGQTHACYTISSLSLSVHNPELMPVLCVQTACHCLGVAMAVTIHDSGAPNE